jgi:hypothetical protein
MLTAGWQQGAAITGANATRRRRPPMITLYGFGPYLGMPDGSPLS